MESGKRCRVVQTAMPLLRERSTAVSAERASVLCAIRGIAALLVRGSAIRAARYWLRSPPGPRPNCQPRIWSRTTPAGHSAIFSRRTPQAAATTAHRSCLRRPPPPRPPGKRPLAPRPLLQRPPMSGGPGDGSPWGWGLPFSSPRRSSAISRCSTTRGTRRKRRRGRSVQLPPRPPPLLPRRLPLLLPPRRPPLPRRRRRPQPPFPPSGSFPQRPAGRRIRSAQTATTQASFPQLATSCAAGRSCRLSLAIASGKPSSGLCGPSPDFRLAACRTTAAFTSVRARPQFRDR